MFYIALGAWLVGVIVSYVNENRKLPTVILVLGVAALWTHFTIGLGPLILGIMALLGVVIWIANKIDMA